MCKWIFTGTLLIAFSVQAAEFHIAPTGNDAYPGTTDKPFATLERARDAARAAKGSIVVLAAGAYRLTKTFALDERDSDTIYRAAPGAAVRITGGIDVSAGAVQSVTDKTILERVITEAARPYLKQIDLRKLGVTDYGDIGPRGFGRSYIPAPVELFIDEQPCQIARWPNAGEPHINVGPVISGGCIPRKGDYNLKPATFKYVTPRAAGWTQASDLYISGIFGESWADDTLPVATIDTKAGTFTTKLPHLYGVKAKPFCKWYALNLLEEIDMPGEYYVDRQSGTLYFYPPAGVDLSKALIQVSLLPDVMVAIEGASNVRLEKLTFENSRGNGLYIERGASNLIVDCTFRNLGGLGVQMGHGTKPYPEGQHDTCGKMEGGGDGTPASRIMGNWGQYIYRHTAWDRQAGTGHGILNCSIFNMGSGGVVLGGGDRKTLTPGGNFVRDCDIHQVNRFDRTYRACINVDGVGNIIEHNLLHDTEGQAILLHGNDHRIEYNNIFKVCLDISDMGAFYMGRDPSECGNLIRYNFFHELRNLHAGNNGIHAVYFDDCSIYGGTVEGNVFYKVGGEATPPGRPSNDATVTFNGGGGSPIRNNIFVDCPVPIQLPRKDGSWRLQLEMKSERGKSRLLEEVNITQPPYSTRYPEVLKLYKATQAIVTPVERNYITNGDTSKFVDAAKLNFNLKPGADLGVPGFESIPFDKIAKPPMKQTEVSTNRSAFSNKPCLALLTVLCLNPPVHAWEPKVWQDFVKSGPTGNNLPDFSYAGYHCGEKEIPTVRQVVNVKDFGAIPDDDKDDTKAINDAIAKAAEMGGGAVFIPKGRYSINSNDTNDCVKITQSNIVLRGEGSGKDGTILHHKHRIKGKKENAAVVFMGGDSGATLTQYTKDGKRGDTIITVGSTSSLKAGMLVEICFDSPDIPKALTHPFAFDQKIGSLPQGHLTLKNTKISWPVEIAEILDGTHLRLKQPLRMDQPLGWAPTLKATRNISEVGIENLRLDSSWEGHFAHKVVYIDPNGNKIPGTIWHGLTFLNVWNGWARNICIENYPDPYDVLSSKCLTLSDISTEGTAVHYFLIFEGAHDNLLRNAVIRAPSVHNIQYSRFASGNVATQCRLEFGTADPWAGADHMLDFHGMMPYENLFDQIDHAYIYGGGDPSVFPAAGVRNTFWNISCPKAIKQNKENEFFGVWTTKNDAFHYFPQSFVVGVHREGDQQVIVGNSPKDQINEWVTVEGLNQPGIEPASLYDAQFKKRTH